LIESEVDPAIHPCVINVVADLVERRVGKSEICDCGIVRVGQGNRVAALTVDSAQDFSRAIASAGVIRRVAREARRRDEGHSPTSCRLSERWCLTGRLLQSVPDFVPIFSGPRWYHSCEGFAAHIHADIPLPEQIWPLRASCLKEAHMKASRLATAITAAAACAAIGLIVVSCSSQSGSPVAPGATANLAANIETSPTPTPTPTPTPPSATCSPGFWKNHPEDWDDLGLDQTALIAALKAQGPGSEAIRAAAQATIEAAVIAAHGSLPCSD
jgi:hypothetical protein